MCRLAALEASPNVNALRRRDRLRPPMTPPQISSRLRCYRPLRAFLPAGFLIARIGIAAAQPAPGEPPPPPQPAPPPAQAAPPPPPEPAPPPPPAEPAPPPAPEAAPADAAGGAAEA